ncbi:MAG: 50S ribosome-binding GTPase [Phycisphaeraceae bacterium]|nr:50S ribosome-binding GTPase [Phycisphaeraceae bacterium]
MPGPIAVLQLVGEIEPVLQRVAGRVPDPGQVILARFGDIDTGVIARVNARVALLMPHGGVRIRERLSNLLHECQVLHAEPSFQTARSHLTQSDLYPEADDEEEAAVLEAVARAASPIAMPLLLRQAARLAERDRAAPREPVTADDFARGERLWRLIEPARIAVIGRPNAGKSSLLNRLAEFDLALSGPEPGLTRDAVSARIELDGLVVDWFDTPGLRLSDDPIEREAQTIASSLIGAADLVVSLAEPGGGWPDAPRTHLRVLNKGDLPEASASREAAEADLVVSSKTGDGIAALVARLREMLLPQADLDHPGPWILPRNALAAEWE